jgi:hypothetical protein
MATNDQHNYYEIDAHYTTFMHDGSIVYNDQQRYGSAQVGLLVMMTAAGTVGLVTDGKEIWGKLIRVEPDGECSVQDAGYCDCPTTGVVTYTDANNGAVGGTTPGYAKVATAVPAAGAVRHAQFIKNDGTNVAIIRIR